MSKKMYEKYFTAEQLRHLKANTYRELEDSEEKAVAMFVMMFGALFSELVVVVAVILWTNKFTLFLAIVGMMFVSVLALLSRFSFKSYKETIGKAKEGTL